MRGAVGRHKIHASVHLNAARIGTAVVQTTRKRLSVSKDPLDHGLAGRLPYFDLQGCSPALAKKMRAFIKPLLDAAKDSTPEMEDRLWTLGGLFWNIALNPDEAARKKAVGDAEKLFGKDARGQFRDLAAFMLRRHEEMFPEMHR